MDEHSKVISLRQFKAKRTLNSLKNTFAVSIAFIIGAFMLVYFIGSISYPENTKDIAPNGFIKVKTGITQFK